LSARIPVFLGKISFSLYLLHMVVILTFSDLVFQAFFGVPSPGAGIWIALITTPVLLASSYLMYLGIDRPGIRLSQWVYTRFFSPGENS
jgi:peptidoglycan/LPS O-acetylase OafA/YrhL